jgi:hypothetical protein
MSFLEVLCVEGVAWFSLMLLPAPYGLVVFAAMHLGHQRA